MSEKKIQYLGRVITTRFTLNDFQASFIEVTQLKQKKQLLLIINSILINLLKIIYIWKAPSLFLQVQLVGTNLDN